MIFRIGQKVVCVDDGPQNGFWIGQPPRRGQIYTVRAVRPSLLRRPGVLLEELRIPAMKWPRPDFERGYLASRFRPIVERKTDISIFTKMLNLTPTPPTMAGAGEDDGATRRLVYGRL